jgi:hypothetical protein
MLHFPYWNTHVDKFHDFVDEVGRRGIRWIFVDDKPERLFDTLHATNRDLYTRYIQHHQHLTDNADVVGNKQDIFSVQ